MKIFHKLLFNFLQNNSLSADDIKNETTKFHYYLITDVTQGNIFHDYVSKYLKNINALWAINCNIY